jgi:hypothetical protein
VANKLHAKGFLGVKFQIKDPKNKKALAPHITFDQCGCYDDCSDRIWKEWATKKTVWKLIAVTATKNAKFPKKLKTCESLPSRNPNKKTTSGGAVQVDSIITRVECVPGFST